MATKEMNRMSGNAGQIQAVKRLFSIIDALEALDGAGITALSERTGIPNSTVHRYLSELLNNGYVVKKGQKYHLSLRFLQLGEYVRNREFVSDIIKPKVRQIAVQTGEHATFAVNEDGAGVVVYTESGNNAVKTGIRVGQRIPLHCFAAGKAILAHLPEEDVERIVDERGLPSYTENTITDWEELMEELDEIREQKYALDAGEYVDGLLSVAAPVHGPDEQILGALGVAGPAHRMQKDWIPDFMVGTANEVKLNVKYSE
ncbi:MAG: IclR family transcriptional regulator [Salinigranum sp.]